MYLLRDDIEEIIGLLKDGGTLLYPTDTIWGIGCDATNEKGVRRIGEIKARPEGKSYVLLVDSIEMLKRYVPKVHPRLETLLAFHTRPLTVVYDRVRDLPSFAVAPNGSAAIRVTSDPFCKLVIGRLGTPLVSTSANVSGQPYPPTFGAVSSEIITAVDYVVKYRQDDRNPGEPSVIAHLNSRAELDFIRE